MRTPLWGSGDEAMGLQILPLRQPAHGKVKHSDGYLVQVANRQCVEYVEPHRKAMIEVDFGNSVGVYIETLNGWLSEAGISPMSATDRERVISGIVAGLDACACRKSNPDILVVQPAENWAAKNLPGPFDGTRERRILLQR